MHEKLIFTWSGFDGCRMDVGSSVLKHTVPWVGKAQLHEPRKGRQIEDMTPHHQEWEAGVLVVCFSPLYWDHK